MRRLLLLAALLWPASLAAQQNVATGRVVVSDDSSPVQGATVAWSVGSKLVTVLTDERVCTLA